MNYRIVLKWVNYMEYKEIILKLGEKLVEKKAVDLKVIEFEDQNELFQFIIILTVESFLHQKALCDISIRYLKDRKMILKFPVFLNEENPWVMLDYDFLAIHFFKLEYRMFYNLEELWEKKNMKCIMKN